MKKIFTMFLFIIISMFLFSLSIYTSTGPYLRYNYNTLEANIIINDNISYIDICDFNKYFNEIDCVVDNNEIEFSNNEKKVNAFFNSAKIYINNAEELQICGMPYILNDNIYIPIRVILETFGYYVYWDNINYGINIISPNIIDSNDLQNDTFMPTDKLEKILENK